MTMKQGFAAAYFELPALQEGKSGTYSLFGHIG